jgi:tRNA threonylcarbamoyladenosine biosynthesis protein TsaB
MILSIDASTTGCSVALFDGFNLVSSAESRIERSSAEMLTTLIDNVLKTAKVDKKEIHAIAVAKGPGSYTGLRIAVSTAKGLAFALDKPLLSFGTLDLLAHQVFGFDGDLLCPLIDARRMEVYCQIWNAEESVVKELSSDILDESSYHEFEPFICVGDGSIKMTELWSQRSIHFDSTIIPSASGQISLAYQKFIKNDFLDVSGFVPNYLKEFQSTGHSK